MGLELRQMRQVLALAEHGSFARAALALHLSQPALSRSIQLLEQQIGSALFLRTAAGVVPTDTGRLFVQRSRQVVQLAEDLDQSVQAERTLQSGQLTVGSGPFPLESVITSALGRFMAAYPAIGVRVRVRDWDELLPRLRARELDFFVAEISTLKQEPDLEVEPMAEHALYFVGRAAHPLAGRDNVSADQTLAYPFIAPARIPPRLLEPMLRAGRKLAGRKAAPQGVPFAGMQRRRDRQAPRRRLRCRDRADAELHGRRAAAATSRAAGIAALAVGALRHRRPEGPANEFGGDALSRVHRRGRRRSRGRREGAGSVEVGGASCRACARGKTATAPGTTLSPV